ncbi:MAG: PspC domain-containing protein [Planctomycetota bacterium]|jgi:phage shock protein PspC (stress-responsive transcriptional regulator)
MKKLYLATNDKKLFGVCGGFGETGACPERSRRDLDPTTVRIAAIFLCLATGVIPLLITYFIAWIIMPKAPKG